jgi:4-alpha-glucanotransferase
MSTELRWQNPDDERINVPANPKHYWRYRMHLSVEQLIKEDAFNDEVRNMVIASGRA